MSDYKFCLAKEKDEPELRAILRDNPVSGDICISFQREPNFFYATKIGCKFNQIIMGRDEKRNKIFGLGSRSLFSAYINGEISNLGYLSSLRLDENYRNATLLYRGYQFVKELHQDKITSIYITSIIEENKHAKRLLTNKRAGLPSYHDFGAYYSSAVFVSQKKEESRRNFEILRGTREKLDEIIECLRRNGALKQFYPAYSKEDFVPNGSFLRDFKIEDFYVAYKDNRIIGVMAKWDQSNFKQTIVTAYKGKMRGIKPFYNFGARVFGYPLLPSPGSLLNFFYVCFIAIDNNDLQIFRELLRSIYNDTLNSRYSYFLLGLHSRDPLLKTVGEYSHLTYKSRIYAVCWNDGEDFVKKLDNRVPYLEISTL